MAPKHETPIAVAIALMLFVLPVSFGFAFAPSPRWVADHEPLDLDGPIPEGVIRLSEVRERGGHADQCTDITVELTDEQRASLTLRALVDAISWSFSIRELAAAPCAELAPYPAVARCVERRRSRRPAIEYSTDVRFFDPDEGDRHRCRGQWTELQDD